VVDDLEWIDAHLHMRPTSPREGRTQTEGISLIVEAALIAEVRNGQKAIAENILQFNRTVIFI
jgi:hypothetical protein